MLIKLNTARLWVLVVFAVALGSAVTVVNARVSDAPPHRVCVHTSAL